MTNRNAINLYEFAVEIIRPKGPFCAKTTLVKPSHFPSPFDHIESDRYRFVTRIGNDVIGVEAWSEEHSAVGLRMYCADSHIDKLNYNVVKTEIKRRLGLEMDLSGFEAIWKNDDILQTLPIEMMGARPSSPFSLYEFLMICVFLQNTTVRRTVAMAEALAREVNQEVIFPDGVKLHVFWTPIELIKIGEERMRDLRLGYRAKILDRLSQQFKHYYEKENKLLTLCFNENELLRELMSLYGIGPASIGYVMFEWFKIINYLEHISPWERKILSMLLFESEDIDVKKIINFCKQRWAPFTMLAIHAIFESVFWQRVHGNGPRWLDAFIRL